MRRKFPLLVLTVHFVGLIFVSGSWCSAQAQSYRETPAVGNSSTLLKSLTAADKRRFDDIMRHGFELKYKIRGKSFTAFAVGNKRSGLRDQNVKLVDGSLVMKALTKDGALEITTYFTLDNDKHKLTIDRTIRNTSKRMVKVQKTGEYLEPKLVLGGERVGSKKQIARIAWDRIKAGRLVSIPSNRSIAGFYEECHCVPPPECPLCPPNPPVGLARLNPWASKRILLQWNDATVLEPHRVNADPKFLPDQVRFIIEVDMGRQAAFR